MDLINIILLAILGGVLGLGGGLLFLLSKTLSKTLAVYSMPYAAGVLIATSILHMIPEAVETGGKSGSAIVLFAFLASFFFEEFFANIHHHGGHAHATKAHKGVILVLVGDTIHNFIDGVAIAASYMIDPSLGIIVAVSTFLHEVPHEIGDFGILISNKWSKKSTILANLASSLVTIFGAFVTYIFSASSQNFVSPLLAVSAGVFLYLGATDFLPDLVSVRKTERKAVFAALIMGVLMVVLLTRLLPEK